MSPELAERGVGLTLPEAERVPHRFAVAYQEQASTSLRWSGSERHGGHGSRWSNRTSLLHRGARSSTGRPSLARMTMPALRLFASAREAAGTGHDCVPGRTVAEVLAAAAARYGEPFEAVLASCSVWRNGEPASGAMVVDDWDEIAVLPPVSGGGE